MEQVELGLKGYRSVGPIFVKAESKSESKSESKTQAVHQPVSSVQMADGWVLDSDLDSDLDSALTTIGPNVHEPEKRDKFPATKVDILLTFSSDMSCDHHFAV